MFNKIPSYFIILIFAMISSFETYSQQLEWASGLRIGEPGGFMIRKYIPGTPNLIEFNFGAYGGLWGTNRNYKDGVYKNIGFSLNALYLWHHKTISNENIQTFYGLGLQYNNRDLYEDSNNNNRIKIQKSIGGVVVGGIEFFPKDAPNLSFFTEIGFYNEISPKPFFIQPQGGFGARVNF